LGTLIHGTGSVAHSKRHVGQQPKGGESCWPKPTRCEGEKKPGKGKPSGENSLRKKKGKLCFRTRRNSKGKAELITGKESREHGVSRESRREKWHVTPAGEEAPVSNKKRCYAMVPGDRYPGGRKTRNQAETADGAKTIRVMGLEVQS